MGKKGNSGWFMMVKRVFKSTSKEFPEKKDNQEKWHLETPEVVLFDHFQAESSADATNEESVASTPAGECINHDMAVAAATAEAREAAAAAAQAAAKVVRMAGYRSRCSVEESAATVIQTYYRGYLARRALRALKALVKLQALVRGYNIRKKAQITMRCMQALVHVQARVRSDRLQLARAKLRHQVQDQKEEENPQRQPTLNEELLDNRNLFNTYGIKAWDNRQRSPKKIKEDTTRERQGVVRRERAIAYAYAHQLQQQQRQQQKQGLDEQDIHTQEKTQWDRNWLETWMASQSYQSPQLRANEGTYTALKTTSTATATDNISEKAVEMDMITPTNTNMNSMSYQRHLTTTTSNNDPSYMTPTLSAKAKVRNQSSSAKRGSVGIGSSFESSNSGGGTSTNRAQRSPNRGNNTAKHVNSRERAGYNWRVLPPLDVPVWRHGLN